MKMAAMSSVEKLKQVSFDEYGFAGMSASAITAMELIEPPSNVDEFLLAEGLKDWPILPLVWETDPLDFDKERAVYGMQGDIQNILMEAAPLNLSRLEGLELKLEEVEAKLLYYARRILTDKKRDTNRKLFHSPNRTFITEVGSEYIQSQSTGKGGKTRDAESVGERLFEERRTHRSEEPGAGAMQLHSSGKIQKSASDFADTLIEIRKRSLEYSSFPGFRHGELIELPAQLESPPVLHRVTNAQDFNAGFKKFWKKLFLSEASVAIMQDMFWWFYLDKFAKKSKFKKDRNRLYDRIADSFVALFISTNKDVIDKFMAVYPDCLAQAVYATYLDAFPESEAQFNDEFKQYLLDITHEWMAGLKPVPGTWKHWDTVRLISKGHKDHKAAVAAAVAAAAAAAMKNEMSLSLDMESFHRLISKMGIDPSAPSREVTKVTQPSQSSSAKSKVTQSMEKLPFKEVESHQIGPGPDFECVQFNTNGRSPLIAHYLHMRQLQDFKQPGKKVRRMQVSKEPAPGPTYQDLIRETLAKSAALSKQYQKVCNQTNNAILDLEKKKNEMNKEIDNLQKELLFTRNPIELKMLADKISKLMERDRSTPLLTTGRELTNLSDLSEDAVDSVELANMVDHK